MNIVISEETTAIGFWHFAGSTCELRIAANQSFRNSDGQLVPRGLVSQPKTCLVIKTCTVNEDLSVSIPEVTELFTTTDSIDLPTVTYTAALFPRRSGQRQVWPDEATAQGFAIPVYLGEQDTPNTTTWAQIVLANLGAPLIEAPDTWPTFAEMVAYVRSVQNAKATTSIPGIGRLDVPALNSADPEFVGSNSYAAVAHPGITSLSVAAATPTNPISVGDNDYRLTTQGIDIREFGVVGDGVTDDTTAFQSAINNSPLRRLFIPRTLTIKITSFTGLHIYGKIGLVIEGEKGGSYQDTGSKIIYAGTKHGTLFNIINSGSITLKDLTLSSGGFTEGLSNYADILVNIDKSTDTVTYGSGSTSDITIDNVTLMGGTINTNNPNVNAVGILVNKTGTSNCELMKFRRVFGFFGGTGYNDPTNTLRGQFIQFYNNGNNSLNNVVEDCYGLGAYIQYEARNGAQVRFVNNEGNYPSIVYKIAGDGNCQIIGDRTETHRQFLVATGTSIVLLSNIIPYGGWDATGTYPVIQAIGSTLEMLRNGFIAVHTPGVKYVVGDASSRLRSICNSYLDNVQALADFLTFGQGAQSQSDNVSDGSGVTFNNGYPIIYPGVSGGQAKQSILSSYDYVGHAFYSAFMQHTDSGLGKAIECGADKFLMAQGRVATSLTMADVANIILNTSTGSQIATAVGQKLAFHGSTPVIQRAGAAQAAVATTGATNTAPYGYSQSQANAIVTLLNELRQVLVEKGLMRGSA